MSSVFGASCAVYWLTWIISLSYLNGVMVFETRYIRLTDHYLRGSKIVKLVCYLNVSLSFIGCIFVKCDVSHILCFLLFTLPLTVIVPALSIYGIVLVHSDLPESENAKNIEATLLKEMNHTKPGKRWLETFEEDSKCCGVRDWRDYLGDLIGTVGNEPVPKAENYPVHALVYVPKSCCNYTLPAKECNATNVMIVNDTTTSDNGKLHFSPIDAPFYSSGCKGMIADSLQSIIHAHTVMMVILLIASLIMALIYVKSWCSRRNLNGGKSNHSLDVENIPALDIRVPNRESTDSSAATKLSAYKKVSIIRGQTGGSLPPPPVGASGVRSPSLRIGSGSAVGTAIGTASSYKLPATTQIKKK